MKYNIWQGNEINFYLLFISCAASTYSATFSEENLMRYGIIFKIFEGTIEIHFVPIMRFAWSKNSQIYGKNPHSNIINCLWKPLIESTTALGTSTHSTEVKILKHLIIFWEYMQQESREYWNCVSKSAGTTTHWIVYPHSVPTILLWQACWC